MLLRKITLSEFGAYRGEQSLDLTPKKNKPIILIGGLNGCGKTTLLDAIQLALYGRRARCSGRGNKTYESYLHESINRQADPTRGASVTLDFTIAVEGREHYYSVIRSWRLSGKSVKEFLNVFVDEQYGELAKSTRKRPELKFSKVLSEGWADHVEDLLPLEVASLSFFDGEKIESLADPDRAASFIKSAIRSLLGISTVEQLRTDLQALQRRQTISNEEQHLLDGVREQEQESKRAEQERKRAQQELDRLTEAHDEAKEKLEDAERAYKDEGGALFEQRVTLESARNAAATRLADTRVALIASAGGSLPLLMADAQLKAVSKQARRERVAAQACEVLDVLAERDTWLLDRLPEQAREDALKAMEADRAERAAAADLDVDLHLPANMLSQLEALTQTLDAERNQAHKLLAEAEAATEELAQLDRQLAGVPEKDEVHELLEDRAEHMRTVAVAADAVDRALQRVEEAKRHESNVNTALDRAHKDYIRTKVKEEEVNRINRFSEKARETLGHFSTALLQRHISRLEVAMLQSLQSLMRKQGLVKDIRIDTDNFTLTLSDTEGEEINPGRLSAGERQLLAVSLLWGLMKVAGNRLPSVIDTPLGRLDSRHREHLVDRYFPHASGQVLLLSTDEEIDEHLLGRLNKAVAQTYTLTHDDIELTTKVVKGYLWNAGASNVA
ncbi:DNA sulfur modification protein DndD [Streptomyces sp. DSM 41527]|uniref:Nuclease SbcCD subunit C n=1 Tax=Streptomyces mooreae TaxID=3075523 RepID=A0ABU2T723_9ACTN|nr:DNA sulfur modification protein DndD [Streptomyces sp. DSM 41527]MDT0457011.1 DNA sulfur modification protein DndD [Streptomyces sp. DSM 41527]